MSSSPNLPPSTPWPPETSTWNTYPLHCHCGSIRFNIKLSPPLFPSDDTKNEGMYTVGECNCSYCERNGYLSVHPKQENVEFTQGEDKITKYYFGKKECPHWFCKDCGSVVATDLSKLCEGMGIEKRYGISNIVWRVGGLMILSRYFTSTKA